MPLRADATAIRLRFGDRLAARMAGLSHRRMALVIDPAWPVLGDPELAEMLLGNPKDGPVPRGAPFPDTLAQHGFAFLDDLASHARPEAYRLACAWVDHWLTSWGRGGGPGWHLLLAAARLERLTRHADWLCSGPEGLAPARLERALACHHRFALRRLGALRHDTAGLVALARLIAAAAVLDGAATLLSRAQTELDPLLARVVASDGGIADRCPETVGEVFIALAFAARALDLAEVAPLPGHREALARMAPVVRALRLGDGRLTRCHGGHGGVASALDAALSVLSAPRSDARPAPAMGFVRLARGRAVVIADLELPPVGVAGADPHASTLGFEMSDGRSPLLVNCGSGVGFGADWQRVARMSASHNTLILDRHSSTPVTGGEQAGEGAVPGDVQADIRTDLPDAYVVGAHNGYVHHYGLIHVRRLDLDLEGDTLRGEDLLSAVTEAEKRRFQKAAGGKGVPYALRFHLHPDVDVHLDDETGTVLLALPNGARWRFRHAGDAALPLRLDASVYLDNTRAEPRASRQIVLEGRARDFATTLRWSFGREAGHSVQPNVAKAEES